DQVSGLPERFFPVVPAIAQTRGPEEVRLTALFAKIPATIRYGGDRAFYAPSLDIIQMPPKSAFPDATRFLSTKALFC
ncbi:MAG: zincin-like metallopeptidase domain-containing protein, partial [Caulobacterales bacterium]